MLLHREHRGLRLTAAGDAFGQRVFELHQGLGWNLLAGNTAQQAKDLT